MRLSSKKPGSPRSLSATLAIAFFTLSIVAILLSGAFLLYSSLRAQQEAIGTNLNLVARDAAQLVSSFFQDKFGALETLAAVITPTQANAAQDRDYLQSLLGSQPGFRQLSILDPQAHEIARASRVSASAENSILKRIDSAASAQLLGGKHYISPVYIDPTTSEPLVLLAVPVRNPFGEVVGAVAAELNLKFMWDLVDRLEVGRTGYAYVVDRQGNLLAFRDTSRVLKGENVSRLTEVGEFVNKGKDADAVSGVTAGIEGSNVVGTFVPLGTPDWALVTELPFAEAYSQVISSAIASVIILIGIAVLSAVAGLLLARRLAVPLINLTETATRISEGELNLQAKVAGPAEVSGLATSFNHMTARLRETLAGLEARVAERTQELESKRDELATRNRELEANRQELERGRSELEKANVELQQTSQYLSALNETTLGLVSRLDIRELLGAIVSRAAELVQTENGYLYQSEPNENGMVMRVGTGLYEHLVGARATLGKGLAGKVWETGQVLGVPDYQHWSERLPGAERAEIRSAVGVPLLLNHAVVGILGLAHSEEGRVFGEAEIQVLSRFGQLATLALENARLFEQTQSALAEMQRLNEIGSELNQLTSSEELLEIASRSAFANDAASATLWMVENDASGSPGTVRLEAFKERNPGARSLAGRSLGFAEFGIGELLTPSTEGPIFSANIREDARFEGLRGALPEDSSSAGTVVLPLAFEGRWLAFFVMSWAEPHEFSASEQRLYRLMLAPLGLALNNRLSFQRMQGALDQTVLDSERLRLLNELSSELNRAANLQDIVARAIDNIRLLAPEGEASIALVGTKPDFVDLYEGRGAEAAGSRSREMSLTNTAMRSSLEQGRLLRIADVRAAPYADTLYTAERGARAAMIVPLIGTDNREIGALNVVTRAESGFSAQDEQLMRQVGAILASAIENRRLFEQTQSALAEARRLAERERESAEQVMSLNRRLTGEGWEQFLVQQQGTVWVEDASAERNGNGHEMPELAQAEASGVMVTSKSQGRSTLAVPIVVRGEVIGTIGLEDSDSEHDWSPERIGIINDVVENLGLALDNARLFTETQRRVTELDALNQISQAVSSELDLESLLTTIGTQLRKIFDVENTYIALYDRETQMISLPYFVTDNERVTVPPMRYGEGLSSQIIRTRQPLIVNQNTVQAMESMGAKVFGKPALSYLGVPIFAGEDVTGVISIQSTAREGMFDESHTRLLETIAATVGTAIQSAQLYGAMQQEVVTRQRAEEEIKLSLKEKEVLLKEIHHRVKNNLQIITSLLNLQSAQIKDPDAVMLFRESQSRVRSMALIHEKLYQSKDLARIDFEGYLHDLMVYLFRSYAANADQIRIHVDANNMSLGIDTAIPCGLMISELVTNTLKYAFPNGRRGNLYVSVGPEDAGHLTLLVKDDGVGFKEGFDWRQSDSLGLQLVSTLTSQLHGTIEVNGVGGTSFKITFPG